MKKNFLLLLCALFALGLTFQSCSEDDELPQVGVCLKSPSNNWRKALTYYAEKKLNELNLTYNIASANNKTEQAQQITAMVNKGCQVIIISPEGVEASVVNAVIEKGISVILLEEAVVDNYTSLVKVDNQQVGKNAATYIKDIPEIKKIAVFDMSKQDAASSNGRINGFKSIITDNEKISIIENATYSFNSGKTETKKILASMPDVNAIYAQDDDVALGVLAAIDEETDEKKKTQIKVVVGCGGSQEFFNKIKNTSNITLATTLYSPSMIGKCVELAADVLKGQTPPKDSNSSPTVIQKSNVEEYLDLNSPY